MAISYANPTSGPSAGGIGWFVFDTFSTINPGQTITGLTGTLNDGTTVTFDLTATNVSGVPRTFDALPIPVYPGSAFGTSGYTGIVGNAGLNASLTNIASQNRLTLSNIVVKDNLGNLVPNYTAVVADAEITGGTESWVWNTNGGVWAQLAALGSGLSPILTGLGTATATLTGGPGATSIAYVLTTQNPTQLHLTTGISVTTVAQGREAVAIGFATTRVHLQKNVTARIDPTDQFQLNITGTPSSTTTTVGATTGIQTQVANVFAIPDNAYVVNEGMAPGSVSALSDYTQIVSAANATPAGSVPPTGNLPISLTPVLGDDVTYTVLNVAPEVFAKTVDKSFSDVGDILTYTISVDNPNDFALSNVFVTDATPAGTTYLGNIVASLPTAGTDLATGITFPNIPATTTATISWQVQVNNTPPVPNPVPNVGFVNVPGGTSGNTNAVTTQVNTAFVTINKVADKTFANVGEVITYTFTLMNAGNVSANSVVLTDVIPTGTTFVAGSLTGATGVPPTLTLANPIPAGGNTIVTFQVLVGNTIPNPSLLSNSATVAYTYTVDPANPNGASGNAESNLVTTQVNSAIVSTTKETDLDFAAPGDIITYTITLTNSGNTDANNTVLTDAIPAGTTFVPGSLVGATGTPPTLTLNGIVPAGGSATVTFQVQVGTAIPVPDPLQNSATVAYTYTVDPAQLNGVNGTSDSNSATTQINGAIMNTVKSVDKAYAEPGDVLTYTLTLTNSGNVPANNVVINDAVSAGTTFVAGSVTGATGTPPTLILTNPVPAGGAATITFQVQVGNTIPVSNPIPNTASVDFTFTTDPAQPNGRTGVSDSNTVTTQINSAIVTASKTADQAFADVNGTVSYTIALTNTGNVAANNVILTDSIPAGSTFVVGSLVGATGTPPTLILANPVPAGGIATVSFDVLVGNHIPNPNPLENSATAAFTYTVNPAQPNGVSGTAMSGDATTQVNHAQLVATKSVDKPFSYIGDTITYQISVKNTGNVSADNVVLIDLLPTGVSYVAGSLVVSGPYSGTLASGLALNSSIPAGDIVTLSFKAKVDAIPNPNPIVNKVAVAFAYTVEATAPNAVTASVASNSVSTIVFRYNFGQQISDLIESVALEQAALAAIAQAEGAKIQKMVAMSGVTTQELLCLNKSVTDMMDSIAMLEAVLKQKLNVADCQINGTSECM